MHSHVKYLHVLFIGLIFTMMTGCVDNVSSDKIGVLVTIVPQIEMVDFIGGDYVDITVMIPKGQSPHSFEPTPDQMIKVAKATAYFKVGSGVEFETVHMHTIIEQNPDLLVYDCSNNITVVSFDEQYGQEHYGEHDYEGTDPHVWTSPVNFKKMAEVVLHGLIEIDSSYHEQFYANYEMYISKLNNLHVNVSNMLQPYRGRSFMVYHPAWGYFGTIYSLKQIAVENEGQQPGPAGVAAIIQQAKDSNITVIFVAPQFDTSSALTIADEIGGNVVFADPLMTDYESTIFKLAEDMVKGFKNG